MVLDKMPLKQEPLLLLSFEIGHQHRKTLKAVLHGRTCGGGGPDVLVFQRVGGKELKAAGQIKRASSAVASMASRWGRSMADGTKGRGRSGG